MALTAVCGFAQQRTGNPAAMVKKPVAKLGKIDIRKTYPALAVKKPLSAPVGKSLKRPANSFVEKTATAGRPQRVAGIGGRELWGNMISCSTWTDSNKPYGMYGFKTNNPTAFTQLMSDPDGTIVGNGGSAIVDGTLYLVNIDLSWASYGTEYIYVTYYSYDTQTWERTDRHSLSSITLAAVETAQDAATGTVYGVFYNSAMTGFEFGTIDYKTLTRTTIGAASRPYVALGLAKDGFLYGVGSDGNLYKISTTTGGETLVGTTGVTVSDSSGFYEQSGEIDQKTNTFYWTAVDVNKNCALYTVDLTTGRATKVADFPNSEQFVALTVPADAVADGVPAAADDFKAAFEGPATTGTVSFTVPTKTHDGSTLSGDVDYSIVANSVEVASGKAKPGERVSRTVAVEEGNTTFALTLSNSEGTGAASKQTLYVGYDVPKAVSGLKISTDVEDNTVSLAWTAPTEGVNGGYMGSLTYDVIRHPEGETVKTGLTTTSFTETITGEDMQMHYYGVVAVNGSQRSEEAKSANIVSGDAFNTPYSEMFDDASDLAYFTIVDANGDGRTWYYYPQGEAAANPYGSVDADDWLISPPIRLKAGRIYTMSFKTRASYDQWPERIEVKYGKEGTVAAMTETILEPTVLSNEEYITYKKEISVDEDCKVWFGFHALSDAYQFNLYVDDICVDGGVSLAAPDVAANLSITPDASGALTTTLAFNAPTKAINGNTLTGTMSIDVVGNDGNIVKSFTNVQPGAALTAEDNAAAQGFNIYRVTASNGEGAGRQLEKKAYVGIDVPAYPSNRRVTDEVSAIRLDWDQVGRTGSNGGVVKPEDVSYIVYSTEVDEWGHASAEPIDTVKTNSYTIARNTEEGEQDIVQYAVAAYNEIGRSTIYGLPQLVVGKSYALPFAENLKGGDIANFWWVDYSGSAGFAIANDHSSDNDGCSFAFEAKAAGDTAWINTGKISLAGAASPKIVFDHYATPGADMKLNVKLQKPDGSERLLKSIDYASMTGLATWTREKVVIPAEYASERYVMVKFEAVGNDVEEALYIDNIKVRNVLDRNLAVSASLPSEVEKGGMVTVTATVENIGDNTASAFTISLKANGETVSSVRRTALRSFESTKYEFHYVVPVVGNAESMEIAVAVDYADDLDLSDNTDAHVVGLLASDYPVPTDVKAESNGSQTTFTWGDPTSATKRSTETFESYTPWSTNMFGSWSTIDVYGMSRGPIFEDLTYPGEDSAFSFIAFNPSSLSEDIFETNPELKPHSGNQYLATAYSRDLENYTQYDADEWLISPLLSGEAQDITFWVSNVNTYYKDYAETFEVLASSTGNTMADFSKIGDTYTASSGTWQEYTVSLPAGSKYFAIHRTTETSNSYFFMIDDITYGVGVGKPTSFNIYCDDELVGTVKSGTYTFTHSGDLNGHTYGISAVYASGESAPVNPMGATGIEQIENGENASKPLYTIDGKLVERSAGSLKSVKRGIYIYGSKKIVVK